MKLITKHVSFKYKYDILATQENSGFSEKKKSRFLKTYKGNSGRSLIYFYANTIYIKLFQTVVSNVK